ncbi:Hpt domain-containing protein, partial [Candidatus Thiothrix sp. Deng01]
MRDTLGDEIFEIFCEEVTDISQNLEILYPQWDSKRENRNLLTEIRRAFHTLKGSGRMAGAFALGDFGWVHEDLLNQLLVGGLPANDRVSGQIGKAVAELQERLQFFLQAQQKDGRVERLIAEAEAVIASAGKMDTGVAEPEPDVLDFSMVPPPSDYLAQSEGLALASPEIAASHPVMEENIAFPLLDMPDSSALPTVDEVNASLSPIPNIVEAEQVPEEEEAFDFQSLPASDIAVGQA